MVSTHKILGLVAASAVGLGLATMAMAGEPFGGQYPIQSQQFSTQPQFATQQQVATQQQFSTQQQFVPLQAIPQMPSQPPTQVTPGQVQSQIRITQTVVRRQLTVQRVRKTRSGTGAQ